MADMLANRKSQDRRQRTAKLMDGQTDQISPAAATTTAEIAALTSKVAITAIAEAKRPPPPLPTRPKPQITRSQPSLPPRPSQQQHHHNHHPGPVTYSSEDLSPNHQPYISSDQPKIGNRYADGFQRPSPVPIAHDVGQPTYTGSRSDPRVPAVSWTDPGDRTIYAQQSHDVVTQTQTLPSQAPSQSLFSQVVPPNIAPSTSFRGTKTTLLDPNYVLSTAPPLSSPPERPLRICPKKVPLDYAICWYFHPSTPEFLICSHCYAYDIENTQFASEFTREMKSEGIKRQCMFHVIRMKDVLWKQATATGNLTPVLDFMTRRTTIKACAGTKRCNSSAGIKYFYHIRNEPVDGFIICEACYEDVALAKSFAHEFQPYQKVQTVNDNWSCDAAWDSVLRAFQNHSESNAWAEASRIGIKRLYLQDCPGSQGGKTFDSAWYKPKKEIPGLVICESCYYDRAVNSEFEAHFEFAAPAGQSGWACDMSAWSIRFAYEAAIARPNPIYSIFWDAAEKIMRSPLCASQGMKSDVWYTFPGLKHFNICPACYEGIFRAYNCGDYFVIRSFTSESEKPTSCDIFRDTPRARLYINKYCEGLDTLNFGLFDTLVRKVCAVPSCPRDSAQSGRFWYGYPETWFCEECYALFVIDTALAPNLQIQREQKQEHAICGIYSPRMREKWNIACASGDLKPFLEFSVHRRQVWDQTMPEIRMIIQMREMRMMMALSMGQMAMMSQGGAAISNMAGNTSETWTVSSGGFSGTGGSEFAANASAQAHKAQADVSRMDEMTKVAYLEAQWRAVE